MKETQEDIETRALRRSLRSRHPAVVALGGLFVATGWVSFALLTIALVAEVHPRLERSVERALRERVDSPLTAAASVGDVSFRWLNRSVVVRDLELGPTGEEARVDELVARLGWSLSRGFHLDRVELRGGSVVISEALGEGLGRREPRREGAMLELLALVPDVVVRDFEIALEPPGKERLDVGSVDLCMTRRTDEIASIYGRLVPALAPDPADCGVVWLDGTLDADQVARVQAVARSLPLSTEPLSPSAAGGSRSLLPRGLDACDPRGRVDLVADARFEIGRSLLPDVRATLEVAEGRMLLPWLPNPAQQPLSDVRVGVDVAFAPPDPEHPFDPEAWRASGVVDAVWEGVDAHAEFRVGRDAPEGYALEVWIGLPDALLGDDLTALVNEDPGVVGVHDMLATKGRADIAVGVRLPIERDPELQADHSLERFLFVRARGEAGLAYQGAFNKKKGQRDIGFPLPVRRVVGDIIWSVRPEGRYPGQLGIFDATALHPNGPVEVQGTMHFPPPWLFEDRSLVELVPSPFHLRVTASGVRVDDDFHRAFAGLHRQKGLDEVLPTWNPRGGTVAFVLDVFWRDEERQGTSVALDATLEGVGIRWRELAVPVEGGNGTLTVRTNGDRERVALQLDMEATTPVARGPIRAGGRIVAEGRDRRLLWFDVDAAELNPVSRELRTELARKNPATIKALDASGVAGFVDLAATAVQELPAPEAAALRADGATDNPFLGGIEAWVVGRPSDDRSGVQLQPATIGIVTREAHGRVVARTRIPPSAIEGAPPPLVQEPATSLASRVQAAWRQDGPSVPVVAEVTLMPGENARLVAFGAGLDIANKSLVGALTTVARTTSSRRDVDPFDSDLFDVEGRVDFGTSMELPDGPGVPIEDLEVEVETRLDRLGVRDSQLLRDVAAHFRYEPRTREWIGEEIEARLGETPVRLSNLAWSSEGLGSTFKTRIAAQGLPIDEEHLSFFLDPATVRLILEDLDASGRFDMRDAALTISRRSDGSTAVLLDGELGIDDAFVNLGIPIELRRIASMQVALAHEGRGLRATASVRGLAGAIAGRRLRDSSLELSYVQPRLLIEALDGSFEGGRLTPIGADRAPQASLFSIDLAPPFPFRLTAEMSDVDVGEFLRGVFDSDFANRGRMDLTMRVEGDFEELTKMRGGGDVRIKDSALWAIPVFQALSVGLGIDTTVLFREMYCRYRIEDGALVMDRMRIDSDLLSLVGNGSISFEGDLTSDFEVRYSLVDRLGPFTRFLYWIQNSLLRVSVRGTMERPAVVLRGLVSQFFSLNEERDRLPLPGFSERPERF